MQNPGTETTKETQRCADCGAPTRSFLCDRCAEICDHLTLRGEYWFRRIRPVHQPQYVRAPERGDRSTRTR